MNRFKIQNQNKTLGFVNIFIILAFFAVQASCSNATPEISFLTPPSKKSTPAKQLPSNGLNHSGLSSDFNSQAVGPYLVRTRVAFRGVMNENSTTDTNHTYKVRSTVRMGL